MTKLKASEFGGTVQRNGIAPPVTPKGQSGHTELTAAELLHLGYVRGQEIDTTLAPQVDGESFTGVLTLAEQEALMPLAELWIEKQ